MVYKCIIEDGRSFGDLRKPGMFSNLKHQNEFVEKYHIYIYIIDYMWHMNEVSTKRDYRDYSKEQSER